MRQPSAIPWHARLEARVLVSVVGIAVLSLAAMLIATRAIVTRYSLARSADDLAAAHAAFTRLTDTRRQAAAKATRLIVELPVFRASLAAPEVAADAPTIDHMTEEYCAKLGAQLCVVTDASGRWLGRSGVGAHQSSIPQLVGPLTAAVGGSSASVITLLGADLFLVVSEPALFGREIIGSFTAAFRFDDQVAAELAAITNSEVSFLCGHLCGSSLTGDARQALDVLVRAQPGALRALHGATDVRPLGGAQYVGRFEALDAAQRDLALLLLKDWSPTAVALARIESTLRWLTVVTLVVAVGSTVVFGRRLTRPIRDLADAATEIAAGRWQRHVPPRGPVETRRMAQAFNHMTAVLRDSHEQVQARTQELHIAYERFRAITDSANDAIISVDAHGTIQFWNPGAERLFGYAEHDAIAQPLTLLVPDELQADAARVFSELLAGTSGWLQRTAEYRARRRDGSSVAVEVSAATWTAGPERFITGIVRDITERHDAARALQQREEQLRHAQKMEAIGRLAGGVAHDFNNLLTAILGYTDLLLDETPPAAAAHQHLLEVQRAGRHAAALTRDLLAFSRKQVLQPVVVDLNTIVTDAESLVRRLVGESVELAFALEPRIRCVKADPGQLTQVLLNLAVNARDAMPNGGRLTIATSMDRSASPGDVRLTVGDTGCGMTPEVRAHIFEPFYTTKPVGRGTGLGLATVYGIVQQSGGRISVESAPNLGTTFVITLPGTSAPAAQADVASEPASSPAVAGEKLLLVEDNEAVRSMAREALAAAGYRVLEARNGEEAMRIAATALDTIDAVVTDVVMPVMGGRELVTRLRELRPDLCVLFTSGYASDPSTAVYAKTLGAAFLQKPFVPSTLRRKVRELLERRGAGGEADEAAAAGAKAAAG